MGTKRKSNWIGKVSRRRFLLSNIALLALAQLKGCKSILADEHERRPGIDVHCHVFNASDLSVGGFVQRVLLDDYEDQVVFDPAEIQQEAFIAGLAGLLVKILSLPAITASEEYERLANPDEAALEQLDPTEQSQQLQQILLEVIAPMPAPPGSDESASMVYGADYSELLKAINTEISPLNPNMTEQELGTPEAMTESLLLSGGFIGRNIRWALDLLSSRSNLADRIVKLYGGENGIRLFTPALVDFEYWLNEAPRSSFPEQVEVMDQIQRRQTGGSLIHCFAPFDPWRQIVDEDEGNHPSALELVQSAIMEAGFIGVKLYPPMGFYPVDNARVRLAVPERAQDIPDFPDRLDQALRELYAWCSEHGVPIMAHATNSNSATDDAGLRANPKFWGTVVRDYPQLRINLGHFGGFDEYFQTTPADMTWEHNVGKLIRQDRDSVFADLSYLSEFMGNGTSRRDRNRIRQWLKQFIDEYDPELKNLLYGSDWIMMGREADHEAFIRIMLNLLEDIGMSSEQVENFYTNNAIRFLGLSSGMKTRLRLENYYDKHGLDSERLKILSGS